MEPIIKINNLEKVFQIKKKAAGFIPALKSFFKPEYKHITAVDDLSFTINRGETVAFIGPNGAGKSTTIKMLTGILFPTSGEISVMGLNPSQERTTLAYKIGAVFGQKSQLWYHLPPIDTFYLLAKIYELKDTVFKERLDFLIKTFQLEDLLNTAVKKLSLGQRMRCEIASSLLHSPEIIFLDEPTIGLDVIAKQQVRDILKLLNKQENVTILLTSHDAGDIEAVCKRTMIINHGKIIFDDATEKLKKNYISTKIIELVLEESVDSFKFDQGKILEKNMHYVKVEIDTSMSSVEKLLEYALENFKVIDINIVNPPLENIISKIYSE